MIIHHHRCGRWPLSSYHRHRLLVQLNYNIACILQRRPHTIFNKQQSTKIRASKWSSASVLLVWCHCHYQKLDIFRLTCFVVFYSIFVCIVCVMLIITATKQQQKIKDEAATVVATEHQNKEEKGKNHDGSSLIHTKHKN